MQRRKLLQLLGLLALTPAAMKIEQFKKITDQLTDTDKMPVLFVGHGNPMNAITENSFTEGWRKTANGLPQPKAILCISAHWETRGTFVTMAEQPRTIHDFGGFPQALFDVQYPAPGAPEFAEMTKNIVTKTDIHDDHSWGLDHGTWSVLVKMFPDANVPVYQLSIDYTKPAQYHYELAQELAQLRKKGVLIVGSGNIVHNLMMAKFGPDVKPYDWALEFDAKAKDLIDAGDHHSLIHYENLGREAQLSIPTPEHYLPLIYSLGLQEEQECVTFFNETMDFGSGSMRSLIIQ